MTVEKERFMPLVKDGALREAELLQAQASASVRGRELEGVLLREFGVSRCALLNALSSHFGCDFIQYDEREPVPTELFAGLDAGVLRKGQWFPVAKLGDTVVIAAVNPDSQAMRDEVMKSVPAPDYAFKVALPEDVRWYIQDYLHAQPKLLIGIERTGLAYWRNIMALWRTRMACYRTAHARARTSLKLLRWGLAVIALSNALMRISASPLETYHAAILLAGVGLAVVGLHDYLKVRRSRMGMPWDHALVDITAATIQFTDRYHLDEADSKKPKGNMLARLGDMITDYCSILAPVPASKERTHLARERNMLAAQRTIAGCHRTLYARARTGLSFIRTGIAFISLGVAMNKLLGGGPYSFMDYVLVVAGLLMTVDGLLWYLPARRVKYGIGRSISE
jgi:uncharacterized membrane protein YidH (DUF202 family)